MSYRDNLQAAELRKQALARELEDVEEERQTARRALDGRVERLRREIAATEEAIQQARTRLSLPLLDNVAVDNPCPERWESMDGDDYVRFCGRCEKNVYNLSALDADQAEALLRERGESMCITFYRRPDGTVLTQACNKDTRRHARRRKGMVAAAVLATGLGLAAAIPATQEPAAEPAAEQYLGGRRAIISDDLPDVYFLIEELKTLKARQARAQAILDDLQRRAKHRARARNKQNPIKLSEDCLKSPLGC